MPKKHKLGLDEERDEDLTASDHSDNEMDEEKEDKPAKPKRKIKVSAKQRATDSAKFDTLLVKGSKPPTGKEKKFGKKGAEFSTTYINIITDRLKNWDPEKEGELLKQQIKKRAEGYANIIGPLPSEAKFKKAWAKFNPGEPSELAQFLKDSYALMTKSYKERLATFSADEKQKREGKYIGRQFKRQIHATIEGLRAKFRSEPENKIFNDSLLVGWNTTKVKKTKAEKRGENKAYRHLENQKTEADLTAKEKADTEFMMAYQDVKARREGKVAPKKAAELAARGAASSYARAHDLSQGVSKEYMNSRAEFKDKAYEVTFLQTVTNFKLAHPDFDWEFENGRRAGNDYMRRSTHKLQYKPGDKIPPTPGKSTRWNEGRAFGIQEYWHNKIVKEKVNTDYASGWRAGYAKGAYAKRLPTQAEIKTLYSDDISKTFSDAYILGCDFRMKSRTKDPDAVQAYKVGLKRGTLGRTPPTESELDAMDPIVGTEYNRGYRNGVQRNIKLGRDPRLENAKKLARSMLNRGADWPDKAKYADREPKGKYAEVLYEYYTILREKMETEGLTLKKLHAMSRGRDIGWRDAMQEKPLRTPPKKKMKEGSSEWHWWQKYNETHERVTQKIAEIKALGIVQAIEISDLEKEADTLEGNTFLDVLKLMTQKLAQVSALAVEDEEENEEALEAQTMAEEERSYQAICKVVDSCAVEPVDEEELELKDASMEEGSREARNKDEKKGEKPRAKTGKDEKEEYQPAAMEMAEDAPASRPLAPVPASAPAQAQPPRLPEVMPALIAKKKPAVVEATTSLGKAQSSGAPAAKVVVNLNLAKLATPKQKKAAPAQAAARSPAPLLGTAAVISALQSGGNGAAAPNPIASTRPPIRHIPKKKKEPPKKRKLDEMVNGGQTAQPVPVVSSQTSASAAAPAPQIVRQKTTLNVERKEPIFSMALDSETALPPSLTPTPAPLPLHHDRDRERDRSPRRDRDRDRDRLPASNYDPRNGNHRDQDRNRDRDRDSRDGYRGWDRERRPSRSYDHRDRDHDRRRDGRDGYHGRDRERLPGSNYDPTSYDPRNYDHRERDRDRDRDSRHSYPDRDRDRFLARSYEPRDRDRDRREEHPDRNKTQEEWYSTNRPTFFGQSRPATRREEHRDERPEKRQRVDSDSTSHSGITDEAMRDGQQKKSDFR